VNDRMTISVIVPVFNNAADLRECIAALARITTPECEILVVDDCSTDESAAVAAELGARVVMLGHNSGPATARNRGARLATGEILFFVDADVVVADGVVARVAAAFAEDPDLAAVFGSYDSKPRATGVVSCFRNLLHHYTHQTANSEAFTFWAGCGAIRRRAFESVGGFDERWTRPSIEDIELGYRLRDAGHRIRLDRDLLCTHLKRWTLGSMVRTDLVARAIPWTRLILQQQAAPRDLNLRSDQRVSVALVAVAGLSLAAAPFQIEALLVAALALGAIAAINLPFYRFLSHQRGAVFALACFPLHLIYFATSGLGFAYAWLERQISRLGVRR
jgi:hypothetical protein